VILVGAGPGDPNLLTPAARDAIARADRVFFDALIPENLIRLIPVKKRVKVGKRANQPSPKQRDINRLLIAAARRSLRVVRLKGGDPFVFGRGGEEADACRRAGIRVRVIPGISAVFAAAAAAGFPITDRRCASSVTLLTASSAAPPAGGQGTAGARARRRLQSLVRLGGTWVFYMGLRSISDLSQKLIRAGASPNLPSAVIASASTPLQRVVTAPLAKVAAAVADFRIAPPALLIVGPVVGLRPGPLKGASVLVMRASFGDQAGALSAMLRRAGADVAECPAIEIVPVCPNPALDRAVGQSEPYDWIFLTSANSVRIMAPFLKRAKNSRFAAVGPGTAAALSAVGVRRAACLLPANDFRAEGLLARFLKTCKRPQRIFIPQAANARDVLVRELRSAGHSVTAVAIYRTRPAIRSFGSIRSWVRRVSIGVVPLTSASIVGAFADATRGMALGHLRLVSIGPITTAAAARCGLPISAESPRATLVDLVKTVSTLA